MSNLSTVGLHVAQGLEGRVVVPVCIINRERDDELLHESLMRKDVSNRWIPHV